MEYFGGNIYGNSILCYSCQIRRNTPNVAKGDYLCSGIKMKEINHYILNGFTYRKSFPGVSAKDLTHHCLPTLQEDKPDSCIINVGSNDVGRMQPDDTPKHILKTV